MVKKKHHWKRIGWGLISNCWCCLGKRRAQEAQEETHLHRFYVYYRSALNYSIIWTRATPRPNSDEFFLRGFSDHQNHAQLSGMLKTTMDWELETGSGFTLLCSSLGKALWEPWLPVHENMVSGTWTFERVILYSTTPFASQILMNGKSNTLVILFLIFNWHDLITLTYVYLSAYHEFSEEDKHSYFLQNIIMSFSSYFLMIPLALNPPSYPHSISIEITFQFFIKETNCIRVVGVEQLVKLIAL